MFAKFVLELLNKKVHETKDFNCDIGERKTYLKEKAGREVKKNVSVVYILRAKNKQKVLGFFTLSSYSVGLKDLPLALAKKLPRYPATQTILLGRLVVDKTMQGQENTY